MISKAETPLEVLVYPVGPDIMGIDWSNPLKFRQLEDSVARRQASIANGYSTRYSKLVDCSSDEPIP
jgi:hypothetical protein